MLGVIIGRQGESLSTSTVAGAGDDERGRPDDGLVEAADDGLGPVAGRDTRPVRPRVAAVDAHLHRVYGPTAHPDGIASIVHHDLAHADADRDEFGWRGWWTDQLALVILCGLGLWSGLYEYLVRSVRCLLVSVVVWMVSGSGAVRC